MRKFFFLAFVLAVFVKTGFAQLGGGGFNSSGGGSSVSVDSSNFATVNSLRPADSAMGLKSVSGVSGRIVFYNGGRLSTHPSFYLSGDLASPYSFLISNTQRLGLGGSPNYLHNDASGVFRLTDGTEGSFSMLKFGAFNSASFPAIKVNGNRLQIRLGNDAGFAGLEVDSLVVNDRPGGLGTAAAFDANGVLGEFVSRRELKDSITHIQQAFATLSRLQPVKFKWKKGAMGGGEWDYGFIAEQIDSVDRRLSMRRGGIVTNIRERAILAFAVKTIQDQSAQIDVLQSRVAALENRSTFPKLQDVGAVVLLCGFGLIVWLNRKLNIVKNTGANVGFFVVGK